jgi:multisubunit Na+/H+ antiporter MnhF subunit
MGGPVVNALLTAATLAIGVLILITLVQIARADTVLDRLLNTALAAANALVLLVLIGFVFGDPAFFGDIGLAYALLAFLFPLAFAKYLENERRSPAPDSADTATPSTPSGDTPGANPGTTPDDDGQARS